MSCRICPFRPGISRRRRRPSSHQHPKTACMPTFSRYPCSLKHVFVKCGGPLQGNPPLAGATKRTPYPAKGDLPGDAPAHTFATSHLQAAAQGRRRRSSSRPATFGLYSAHHIGAQYSAWVEQSPKPITWSPKAQQAHEKPIPAPTSHHHPT